MYSVAVGFRVTGSVRYKKKKLAWIIMSDHKDTLQKMHISKKRPYNRNAKKTVYSTKHRYIFESSMV